MGLEYKPDAKDVASAYRAQLRARSHLRTRRLFFKLQVLHWFRFHRGRDLWVDIEINTNGQRIGLFAELTWVLHCLHYIRAIGGHPRIAVTSNTYSVDPSGESDYLSQFFDLNWAVPGGDRPRYVIQRRVSDLEQLPRFRSHAASLSLWGANRLVSRYLHPRVEILDEVERIVSLLGPRYIGLHWRGTDKVLEAPAVLMEEVVDSLAQVMNAMDHPPVNLFIATDDESFLEIFCKELSHRLPSLRPFSRPLLDRSSDGNPMHLRQSQSGKIRHRLGEDALIDALILSRSQALIRSTSFLSSWCSIFNPVLPVYLLNKPIPSRSWFPETEVMHLSSFHKERLSTLRRPTLC